MKSIKIAIILSLLVAVFSCDFGPYYEQVAYYKSDTKFRVFIYVTPDATIEQIKSHAKREMHTPGCVTVVYYYRTSYSLNTDAITLADNEYEAMELGFRPDCIAGYWKYADGEEVFIENPYGDDE
jgi:hypothetical protein